MLKLKQPSWYNKRNRLPTDTMQATDSLSSCSEEMPILLTANQVKWRDLARGLMVCLGSRLLLPLLAWVGSKSSAIGQVEREAILKEGECARRGGTAWYQTPSSSSIGIA